MKLTTKGQYAVMSMVTLAKNNDDPLSLAKIAQEEGLSTVYLEQLFSKLRRFNLVESYKGPGGGYKLARCKDKINIFEILQAVDESIRLTRCQHESKGCRKDHTRCITHDLWANAEQKMIHYFHKYPIRINTSLNYCQLCRK